MLFRPPAPSKRDLLPWWHPGVLLRNLWNLVFSTALGAGIGFLALEMAVQVAVRISGGDGIGSENWSGWRDTLSPLAWILGCFVAFVAYMSYRMDDKVD